MHAGGLGCLLQDLDVTGDTSSHPRYHDSPSFVDSTILAPAYTSGIFLVIIAKNAARFRSLPLSLSNTLNVASTKSGSIKIHWLPFRRPPWCSSCQFGILHMETAPTPLAGFNFTLDQSQHTNYNSDLESRSPCRSNLFQMNCNLP